MEKEAKIYIAGHRGMVGSSLKRKLEALGYANLIGRTHEELDLTDQRAVSVFFQQEKPDYVFMAAAKVGGIKANSDYPADFIYDNLSVQCNVIHSSYACGVKKLLFLGSSCIYPRCAPQPIKEEYLLTDLLEPTNEAYAIAKISGIKMCEMYRRQHGSDFISAMPTNLYGTNDNYHPDDSHVIPGLIRRFHEAKISGKKKVVCWGTGEPKREFLFVEDLSDACVFLMNNYSDMRHINVGTGKDITIENLAELIAQVVGYKGEICWDHSKPDGMPRKLLDVSRLNSMGWEYTTELSDGLKVTYKDYVRNHM